MQVWNTLIFLRGLYSVCSYSQKYKKSRFECVCVHAHMHVRVPRVYLSPVGPTRWTDATRHMDEHTRYP